jgi:hypothetical protein
MLNLLMGEEVYLYTEPAWYETIRSEGGNQFRFLNLFSHPAGEVIPEGQRDFFFKVINSIKNEKFHMDADGLAAVNISGYPGLQFSNLVKLFSPKYCIFWGVDPGNTGLHINPYEGKLEEGCRVVWVQDIDIIESSDHLKKSLWKILKAMFEIS